RADLVYLAPDPDREGEAIAWHLKEALGLSDDKIRRVTFNEITKTAVNKAFAGAGDINMDLVAAQEARRFLDRIVGYKLSPLLSRKLAQHLSAGRVQSVTVRLIVDREREIQKFKPEEFWKILALVSVAKGPSPLVKIITAAEAKAKAKAKRKPTAEATENGQQTTDALEEQLPEGSFWTELVEWKGQKFAAG